MQDLLQCLAQLKNIGAWSIELRSKIIYLEFEAFVELFDGWDVKELSEPQRPVYLYQLIKEADGYSFRCFVKPDVYERTVKKDV